MKISELKKIIDNMIEKHGDLEIYRFEDNSRLVSFDVELEFGYKNDKDKFSSAIDDEKILIDWNSYFT